MKQTRRFEREFAEKNKDGTRYLRVHSTDTAEYMAFNVMFQDRGGTFRATNFELSPTGALRLRDALNEVYPETRHMHGRKIEGLIAE